MASTVWKGYISFGMISVPIRLFTAAREEHVSFNQVHAVCGTRVKQQLFCPTCDRVVERNEIAKGYPVDKDTYVLVSPEELKTLEAESSETMEIQEFVKLDDVDPIYYQTSYYTVAEDPGRRAYALLLKSMDKLKLAAVAKLTLHQREQIVLIRPYHKGLILHTLFYPNEVRDVAEYGTEEEMKLQPAELALAEQFMEQLTGSFDPDQFRDEYQSRVEQLVESKQAGLEQPAGKQGKRKLAPVVDLMEALKKSIEAQEGGAPKKAPKRAEVASVEEAKPASSRKRKAV